MDMNTFNAQEDLIQEGVYPVPEVPYVLSLNAYKDRFTYFSLQYKEQSVGPLPAQSLRVMRYVNPKAKDIQLREVFEAYGKSLEDVAVPEVRIGHILFSDDAQYTAIREIVDRVLKENMGIMDMYLPVVHQKKVCWYKVNYHEDKKEFSLFQIERPYRISYNTLFVSLE